VEKDVLLKLDDDAELVTRFASKSDRQMTLNYLLTTRDLCATRCRDKHFETSIAAPVYLQLHQRLPLSITSNASTITSFASSNDDARVPLATAFGLVFFSPSVRISLRDIPPGSSDAVLRWPPDPDVSPTAHNSCAV